MIETSRADLAPASGMEWMVGGGEMGRLMRELDWSQTTLGPPRRWPAALRTAARIVLASHEPVCVWWGAESGLLFNDACAALLGSDAAAALGNPAPAAWLQGPSQIRTMVERNGALVEMHHSLSISPIPGEGGTLGGVFCAFFDVTAAMVTQRALAQEVQSLTKLHDLSLRLGGMTELAPSLQAILDTAVESQEADFGLVWLQDRHSRSLALEASRNFDPQFLQAFKRVMPGPSGGAAGNAFEQRRRWVIEDVETDEAVESFRAVARAVGFRAVHSTPIVTRSGALLGVISVHHASPRRPTQRDMQLADVCARHAADAIESFRGQEAIRESERLHRAIGESINFGVWVCDAHGRQTYTSESFLKLTGLSNEQCSGEGWTSVLHPDDRERTAEAWRHWMATGGEWDVEHRIRGVDGNWHAVLARGVPVRNEDDDIVGWAGINLDIARLKQVEHELRELDERKNEFLATLAHELRNPLAPLRNGLELIRLAGQRPGTIDNAREMMERQLAQMVRLVDDLLDVSRVSRGKIDLRRERIALAAVLRNAMETSSPLMQDRQQQLVTHMPAGPIVVDADLTRLSQVFWNLLNNAAKYTEPGGRIDLTVTLDHGHVEVAVRDTGIGIPEDMQDRIFDTFTQVDRAMEKSQGGLGIGLSIAKRLVEMHDGTIRVASRGHGQGTEFVVRLPLASTL